MSDAILPYYVLPAEEEPELANFTIAMVTDSYLANPRTASPNDLLLGISAEIPEEFRELVLMHELWRARRAHDHLEASIQEWAGVLRNGQFVHGKRLEYADMRYQTFRRLGAVGRSRQHTVESIRDYRRSEKFWENVCDAYRS